MKTINKNFKKQRKQAHKSKIKYMDNHDYNSGQIMKTRKIISEITCLLALNYFPNIIISRFCNWNSNKNRNLIPKNFDEILIVNNEFYYFNLFEAIFKVHSLIDYQSFMSDQGRAVQDLGAAIAFSNKISKEYGIPICNIVPPDVYEMMEGKIEKFYGIPFYAEQLQQAIFDAEERYII